MHIETGLQSITSYAILYRMETAARLLRRSDLNIQQIIAQVGYENTSYFYRLFHERYGLSPREYRWCAPALLPAAPPHEPPPVLLPPTVVLLPRARRSVFAAKWRKIWYFMEYCVILKQMHPAQQGAGKRG